MSKKTYYQLQMSVELSEYIKEAFCVDGTVDVGEDATATTKSGESMEGLMYKITDKWGGKFYVMICK